MGFFDSITGFLGHVANDVTHFIAPDLKWEPSSLLQQAGKLLPGLAELIPGVGPIISRGISAVESVIGGHDTTDPEPTQKTVLPNLDEVKSLISGTADAITAGTNGLSMKLADVETHLSSKISDLDIELTHKIDADMKITAEMYTEITTKMMMGFKNMSQTQRNEADHNHRLERHKLILAKFDEFEQQVSQAIRWFQIHVTDLHEFVSYRDSPGISRFLGPSQETGLATSRDDLKKVVVRMQDYMKHQLPPTQEILDLYILAVTWLLTYNKLIITLRSHWAHFKFSSGSHKEMSDYLKIRDSWNSDLKTGFIDNLWAYRRKCLRAPWHEGYHNPKDDSSYSFFVDSYPTHGVGSARFELASWEVKQQGLVVIRAGQPGKYDTDKGDILYLVNGLYTGYFGLQSAYFQASTRVAREMAHSWRISADRWQSTAPFSPSGKSTVKAFPTPQNQKGLADMEKHGLTSQDIARGLGYRDGDEVSYVVSYVTSHGEGIPVGPVNSTQTGWDRSFFYLKIAPVEFPKDEGLATKESAQESDKSVTAHIVRRVYATSGSVTRHLIDISAPAHKTVNVWDLGNFAIQVKEDDKLEEKGKIFAGLPDN